ncbi:MAG: phosphatidylserine decarboxylase family protein [Bacteroidales bacterium]|nr:phosphatidylserine decarboxylase family protein [Bacteroidales bacterium]
MKIDHNSYGSVALVYLIGGVLAALLVLFVHSWVFWPLLVLILLIVGWQTAFFRVPRRFRAGGPHSVVSVADGKVVIVDKVFEPEFLKKDCIQISVYMDFFDVHANFWPADGEVTYYRYYPGEHFLAFKPKASEENEHTCVGLRTTSGHDMLFKQLAGGFARRIVCYAKDGLPVKAGEQCGIIKFGSRIDMYVPLEAQICVKVGEQVRACETVIAEL